MPKPWKDVHAAVEDCGAKVLEHIDQRVSMRLAEQEQMNVDAKGICTGFCLDFARRVLLKNNPLMYHSATGDILDKPKLVKKSMRLATGQTVFVRGVVDTQTDRMNKRDELDAEIKRRMEILNRADDVIVDTCNELPAIRNASGPLPPKTYADLVALNVIPGTTRNSFTGGDLAQLQQDNADARDKLALAQTRMFEKTGGGAAWNNVAAALDNWVQAQNTGKVKKHQFSLLDMVVPTDQKLSHMTLTKDKWVDKMLTGPPALGEKMGAMVTFDHYENKKAGKHNITFIRTQADFFYLLDPNYGVFSMNRAALRKTILYLLDKAYWDSSKNEWCEDGTYVLFQRK